MSRTSSAVRSRYTAIGPLDETATSDWQQSQTESSTSCSRAMRPSGVTTADRNVMLVSRTFSPGSFAVSRPSSQSRATPSTSGYMDTNPCSVGVPSEWAVTASLHVSPALTDCDTTTSYEYVLSAL